LAVTNVYDIDFYIEQTIDLIHQFRD